MKRRAFTLIELLVVMSIIGVLAAILLPAVGSVRKSGNKAREIHAGRQLVAAYAAYAADNDGSLMEGYATNAAAIDDLGRPVGSPVCNRYPWRLAKYLEYKVVGTLLVNEQARIVDHRDQQDMYNYMVSLAPTFGMNSMMVGGDYHGAFSPTGLASRKFGKFCITRMAAAHSPAQLIVFASAHYSTGDKGDLNYYGYHTVEPPKLKGDNWKDRYDEKDAHSLGYVDPRYGGQAVVAMLDGHVEVLNEKQLRDMRRWSNQAAMADDPNYTLGQ